MRTKTRTVSSMRAMTEIEGLGSFDLGTDFTNFRFISSSVDICISGEGSYSEKRVVKICIIEEFFIL